MTPDELQKLLDSPEGARVEFKTAASGFPFDDLVRYCMALANERGGHIVLGVSDQRPRRIVGTRAFSEPGRTEAVLFERLGHRVRIEEFTHGGSRSEDRRRRRVGSLSIQDPIRRNENPIPTQYDE